MRKLTFSLERKSNQKVQDGLAQLKSNRNLKNKQLPCLTLFGYGMTAPYAHRHPEQREGSVGIIQKISYF